MWGWHLFWPGHFLGLGLFVFLGPLFRLLVLGGLVVAVVFFVRRGTGSVHSQAESAREILRRRYANGEIGKEEFEEKMKDVG
jgi:uncharacterized membrane protein